MVPEPLDPVAPVVCDPLPPAEPMTPVHPETPSKSQADASTRALVFVLLVDVVVIMGT
jgi:hypothetical protein